MTVIRIGIIGTGLIGSRRAVIAEADKRVKLVAVADTDAGRAAALAKQLGCETEPDGDQLIGRSDIDAVVVATPHHFLPVYSHAAILAGKHVLCEKPMGRNASEVRQVVDAAKNAGLVLRGGFNHRYHPAIRKAHELASHGAIGGIFLLRCRYGHGGRPGYEQEWRGNAELAGGGELLDQGIHAIDLFRWFAGDFVEVFGWTATKVWKISPLEDNAMAILKSSTGAVAQLHASWTQWKNLFSFEIFGQDGYLIVEGLGGSYGTESLTVGRRNPESGPPEESRTEFSGPDISWSAEWDDFVAAIGSGHRGGGEDGWAALCLVDAIYKSARENRPIHLGK